MNLVVSPTTQLEPNIFDLQQDVVFCLTEIAALMGRAKDVLSRDNTKDNSSEKYGLYQQEIQDVIKNVEQLELRMAVVAPMKAGKSTIVNAIIGQELLPSRNAAMTTLPTEIVFNREIKEPRLIISQEVNQIFQSALTSIRQEINELTLEQRQEKISQYPHLQDLLQKIETQQFILKNGELSGHESITEVLTALNDIVRLCSVINPFQDPLAYLTDVIRLETPYLRTEKTKENEQLGNLVIVDTPGPNEAGENLRLTMVVEEQLKKSSVVLIVLDFTQLNNEAAEKVKKQVQPIIELIGKDNLYVLINKVDQRRKRDMTSEQVKEFVYADLNLSESVHTSKVFEVSAIRAFSATKYMLERQQTENINPNDSAKKLKTSETLAQEVFGIDWEDDLTEATIEELHQKAQKLWVKSGFAPFLNETIHALMETAAPRLIRSSLTKSRNRLTAMKEDINLRSKAINRDGAKLQNDIDALEADLSRLELCRKKLGEANTIQTDLQNHLNELLNQLKQDAQVSIEDYFGEEDYQRANLIQKVDMKMRDIFLTPIAGFDPFGFSARLQSLLGNKVSKTIEFKTQAEANSFANDATSWAKQRAEKMLFSTRQYVNKKITESLSNLKTSLDRETRAIIEKARNRLNQDFGIELILPDLPSWNSESVDEVRIKVNQSTRKKTVKKSDKKRRWYVLWTFKIEHTWDEVVDEQYYYVSLETLTNSFNNSVTQKIDDLKSEISEYLEEDFKEKIDDYFGYLDEYLARYRDSLKQSQQDQKLSFDQKKQLTNALNNLLPAISDEISKTDKLLGKTGQIMYN